MQLYNGIIRRYEQSFLREHLGGYNLMPVDSVVLHTLRKKGSCNQDALCNIVDIDKGRMAHIMERLEEGQFIRRIINPCNKREKLAELTDGGVKMLCIIDALFAEWNERCFAGFTGQEREQYESFLERIAQNAMTRKEI